MKLRAGVLTVSDECAYEEREDESAHTVIEALAASGYDVVERRVVPTDPDQVSRALIAWCDGRYDLVLTTGAAGLAPQDIVPEATRAVIDREAPGIAELIRRAGSTESPEAVLFRGVAGVREKTLVINLPGGVTEVRNGLAALLAIVPNAIAMLGAEPVENSGSSHDTAETDSPPAEVTIIETNLDDLSPEFLEPLQESLFAAGALDVYTTPIQMKKNRPALQLTVLAVPGSLDQMAGILFAHTSTFGLRHTNMRRMVLTRRSETVETEYGPIRIKVGSWKGREVTASPEYEDVKAAARAHRVTPKVVHSAAIRAYETSRSAS